MNRRFAVKSLLCAGAFGGAVARLGFSEQPSHYTNGLPVWSPKALGARADGHTNDAGPIQQAINGVASAGGGIVYISPGVYLTGTIFLKSNVTLYLEAGATLLGSADLVDYSMPPEAAALFKGPHPRHLIFAFRETNIALCGPGTVDGQSSKFIGKLDKPSPNPEDLWHLTSAAQWERKERISPMIEIAQCTNVRIEDVTLQNSVGWTLRPIGCNSVMIRGIKIRNPDYAPNSDGIDPSSCENVMISDCDIDTGDDAICLKSDNPYGENKICRNITITNCILSSACNGFKIGAEGPHGFENITFSNSVIYSKEGKRDDQRVISAIDIVMPDGGWIEGVTVSNISVRNARIPICIRLQNILGDPEAKMKSWLRSIMISDIQAFGAIVTSSVTGIPGHPVEDVTLRNIRIQTDEEGEADWARNIVPEREHGYPEGSAFGRFPSFGFYCRHVDGLRILDVDVRSNTKDPRPMVHCDDVSGLEVRGLTGTPPSTGAEVVFLNNVRDSILHGNYARTGTGVYLKIEGDQTQEISLFGNDLHRAARKLQCSVEVSKTAVLMDGLPIGTVKA